ncbi:DNA invertase Pin-like site-specific DNA recombinase/gas vesicle protein [Geobacillus thermodenitrificans]|uniref:recombinase family protein n=1 Tax=Geobacillus thermodenitrificans TaxID=33940 RepID=UPI002E04CB37|nr:recombinase family protein [Geobacillus thermodenitrificans]MEC5188801.1 DNA invertase Pin-like site-specific DNA recombinase/gas vesicle protein [Geobacillus thermodenitrificans]
MDLSKILTPGMKGVFYGRHSTHKQTMETQRRSAYDLAEKYQCTIVEEILDEGVSSRKKDREGYKRLIAAAYEKKFDFVIIYSHSRIARIPEEHDLIRATMHILDIPIIESETESLYDFGDTIFRAIKDGVAKYELDKIRINTKNAIETLAKNGRWTGGRAPFGYQYTSKKEGGTEKFDIVEAEIELVKKVFELYKNHHGFSSIAKQLPENSYRGKAWTKDHVKNIITNPFYAGYIAIRRKHEKKHNALKDRSEWIMKKSPLIPAVLTIEEWEYCWNLYKTKNERKIPPKHFKTSFLLTGLLKCQNCNGDLIGKDQRTTSNQGKVYGKKVYLCKTCNYKIDADDAHQTVLRVFKSYQGIDTEKLISAVQEKVETEISNVKKSIEDLKVSWQTEKRKLQLCDIEIEKAFKRKEEKEPHIKILIITKDRILNKIHQIERWIEEKEAKIKFLEEVQKNGNLIKDHLKQFQAPVSSCNEDMRALFLYLFEEIMVNKKGHLQCKLRFNLEDK